MITFNGFFPYGLVQIHWIKGRDVRDSGQKENTYFMQLVTAKSEGLVTGLLKTDFKESWVMYTSKYVLSFENSFSDALHSLILWIDEKTEIEKFFTYT